MLKSIKRYELNDGVTIKDLKDSGFLAAEPNKLNYYSPLYNDIDLFVNISLSDDGMLFFDDETMVQVIDDNFGQYYTPFYNNKPFAFLNFVIYRYNEVMDVLVEKGILKIKVIDETLEDLPQKRVLKK